MSVAAAKPERLKAKLREELIEYGLNALYLVIVFATFTIYRRLLLSAHDITYTNYGFALIKGLVLGKVIMIGGLLRIGRHFERGPLIYPTLCKTVVFTIFCAVFTLAELGVKGLISGDGFAAEFAEYTSQGLDVVLANSMVLFVALLPFFAVKELGRVLGRDKVGALFFKPRTAA
jgi:hypothetical protein